MSRKTSGSRASFSPTQRKACAVLAVCVLAVILTFIASWVLPGKLSLGGSGRYDPQAYPLDTSLGSVLAKTSDAGTDYVSSTLFVGISLPSPCMTIKSSRWISLQARTA